VIAGKRSVVIKGKGSLKVTLIIHPTNIVLGEKLLSVHISHNHNSSLTDERILMKFYTFVVYVLKKCMKEKEIWALKSGCFLLYNYVFFRE